MLYSYFARGGLRGNHLDISRRNLTSGYQDQDVRLTGETLHSLVCSDENANTDHSNCNSDLYRRMNGDWISTPPKRESVPLAIACVYEERPRTQPTRRSPHSISSAWFGPKDSSTLRVQMPGNAGSGTDCPWCRKVKSALTASSRKPRRAKVLD